MKKYIKNLFIILILFILLFVLTGCGEDDSNILNQKVKEELLYLDLEIVSLINSQGIVF